MKGNTISIRGNLTRDAESRVTQSGSYAVSWGIAWNRSRKNQDGTYSDESHFFDVECWMTEAQHRIVSTKLVKGADCAVLDGHLEFQQWQAKDGSNRSRVVVRCDDPVQGLLIVPRGASQAANNEQSVSYSPEPQTVPQSVNQSASETSSMGYYDSNIPF